MLQHIAAGLLSIALTVLGSDTVNGQDYPTKVVRIVMSYIDFVNRVVWSKTQGTKAESATELLLPLGAKGKSVIS